MTAETRLVAGWSVIGHERSLAALEPAVLTGQPAHAYLFSGPEGVGKKLVATEFAASLNCSAEAGGKPCGECRDCRDILAETPHHPDVEFVGPGGICDEGDHSAGHADSRDIRICQIRRLEHVLSPAPYQGRWRIAIIDHADRLNQDAANAFLKTLEEPPPATVLILVTDREDQLPETVPSRCQRVAFSRVERERIEAALRARDVAADSAAAIAGLANGRIGWALNSLTNGDLLAERDTFLDSAVATAHGSRSSRFAWAKGADERVPAVRERYSRELDIWEQWWRDVLAINSGSGAGIMTIDRSDVLNREAMLYRPADIVRFLGVLRKTREHLQVNVDPQLALEVLTLDIPQPRAGLRPEPVEGVEGLSAGLR
jgi:DNA polymerase-3 subunit delta'